MDINDNQQINTFLKGMNTDVSDALIESSQYRYAENLRLVTNTDSNGGELHLIDGTIVRCGGFNSRMSNALPTDKIEILYLTSIRDYVIVIVRNNSKTPLEWSILVSNDKGYTFNEIFGPCTDPIWTDTVAISGVCRYESDKNVKLYFTDNTGRHGIMSRLIDADHQTRTTDITELTGYQDTSLKQLSVSISDTPGQLKAARVLYSYRLYKYGGGATSVSPLSKVLSLYRSNNYEGYESELISERAVDINVSYLHGEINDNLNRIQIFRINYVQQGQEPTVHLIYDNEFNGSISFTDTGINVEPLSVSEFLSYIQMRIMPKLIESKGDYLYAANIKYVQDDVDEELGIKDDIVPGLSVSWGYTPMETLALNNDQYNYKDQDKTTLRRGEVYRYGVIFYDNLGRASSVKWAGDLQTPDWTDDDIVMDTIGTEVFKTRRVYAKITVPNVQNCSGFEVVRCLRTTLNKRILFLGMVGFPLETTEYYNRKDRILKTVENKCCPSGFLSLQHMGHAYNANITSHDYIDKSNSTKKIILFVCPEYVYQPDDVEDILRSYKNQVSIQHVASYLVRTRAVRTENGTLYGVLTKHSDKGNLFDISANKVLYSYSSVPNASEEISQFAINHVVPCRKNNSSDYIFKTETIKDVGFAKQPNPEHWQNLLDVKFQDDSTPVSGVEYINWTAPTVLHYTATDLSTDNGIARPFVHIGTGGACIVIRPKGEVNLPVANTHAASTPLYTSMDNYAMSVHLGDMLFPINIVNIVNNNATYGNAKYSSYYSFGNYFKSSELGTTVSVYDGDAYIQSFNYNAAHYSGFYTNAGASTNSGQWNEATMCTVYTVPIETDIDLRALCGERFIDTDNGYVQDDPISLPNGYTQTSPSYVYNTAYNQEAITVSGSSQEYTDIDSNNYDTRIHHSQLKTNGEHIDNWLEFKSADFIDVDSRYGEITELKLFKDKLLYWLNTATGVLSANDRTIITDMDNNLIILGNGGVLQRFDYITTLYGMKPDLFADTQSNTTLYWWDGNNKEILAYAGDGVLPLGTLKSVRNYLNERDEVQKPHLFYDEKYKEVIFSVVHNADNYKESLVYNEHVTAFTSIYRFMPLFSTIVQGDMVVANSNSLHTYSVKEGTINNSVLFGDAVRPLLQYVVNKNNIYNKVFDISTFGGRFYGGDNLNNLTFTFDTPLKQHSTDGGNSLITNREYDFRLDIPRNNNSSYGDRMRGKTMQCELKSSSNSTDFSLQYITTKYRMSWS